ncbi:two-component system response regulator DesR [Arthrobacter stackebrandtii]|uniref:Two-component system response regulator DesR n=1 Tax=Arthrobacter stackebrandtii TaxID=272161 RepID=A0ABS4YWU9_9MICC|nr:response regulator transcription factor [Arthrobacter stackebrandtii]MBP2412468.1 two-component system response regulator DesR [Arthrobacter stackebrandtii]PYH02226.1 DNA-binding response regulator [Arthrobacter stackebrandtii]
MTEPAQARRIRLLIADDEHLIRGALEALLGLEPDIEVVASADNGVTAAELAAATQPDICLLDLEMPQADGLEAAAKILATVNTRVIIVTRHARPGVLRRALASKVSGFVPKSTPAQELAHVIRDVAAGKRYIDPDIAAAALTAERCPLTDRELDALRVSRSTTSVAQIAQAMHLAPGTVRNYLSSAMMKLNAASRHEAADRAWQQGWI